MRTSRARLRGVDEQVAKAEKAVASQSPMKRNRFVQLSGGTRTVNRSLEAKTRALAGIKGYVTNLAVWCGFSGDGPESGKAERLVPESFDCFAREDVELPLAHIERVVLVMPQGGVDGEYVHVGVVSRLQSLTLLRTPGLAS